MSGAPMLLLSAAAETGTGEAVIFWLLAPVAALAATGMLLMKKAVHSALLLALIMLCLAVFYIAQDAPFLGVVQVVVYTGAVMMLFLFVLMLVGVDSGDSLVETLRGQRVAGLADGGAPLGYRLRPRQCGRRRVQTVNELGEATGQVDGPAVDVVERQHVLDEALVLLGHRDPEQHPVDPGPSRVLLDVGQRERPAVFTVESPSDRRRRHPLTHPFEVVIV